MTTMAALLRRLDERWGDDRGITPLWQDWRPDAGWWDITRQFHPLCWCLAIGAQREVGDYASAHWLMVWLTLGPVTLSVRREWPVEN